MLLHVNENLVDEVNGQKCSRQVALSLNLPCLLPPFFELVLADAPLVEQDAPSLVLAHAKFLGALCRAFLFKLVYVDWQRFCVTPV